MVTVASAGKVILKVAILTAVVVVGLTLYIFWAAKRGYDFNFLGPFLFAVVLVLCVFALIQISVMIYGGLASIIFAGYIIFYTDNLIKRYSYDEYIWAAVSLYIQGLIAGNFHYFWPRRKSFTTL